MYCHFLIDIATPGCVDFPHSYALSVLGGGLYKIDFTSFSYLELHLATLPKFDDVKRHHRVCCHVLYYLENHLDSQWFVP